jgi:CheY-like chemotaxis protein
MVTPASEHKTILVVDDEPEVRDSTVLLLEALDYQVLQAADASSAIAVLEHGGTVDLLFSDVFLPGGMSGADLAREALSRHPALKVLLTSGRPETVQGDGFPVIGKPFRMNDLGEKLQAVLQS